MSVVTQQAQDELARFRFKSEPKQDNVREIRGTLVYADEKTAPRHVVSGFVISRHIRFVKWIRSTEQSA